MMRTHKIRGLFAIGLFIFISLFCSKSVNAASFSFDQATVSTSPNATFPVAVTVDAGSEQIMSTDAWILYDTNYLEAQSVAAGTFFPSVTNNIASGKVTIWGLITDPGSFKTGTGTIATVTFKALKNGSTTLTYDCRLDVSNSSKIIKNDINATNIIDCTKNGTVTVTIGDSGVTVSPLTPTPTTGLGAASPTTAPPQQLPRTGILENIVKYATPALILLLVGGAIRLIL